MVPWVNELKKESSRLPRRINDLGLPRAGLAPARTEQQGSEFSHLLAKVFINPPEDSSAQMTMSLSMTPFKRPFEERCSQTIKTCHLGQPVSPKLIYRNEHH